MVPTKAYVTETVLELFQNLYATQPSHPIFSKSIKRGILAAPLSLNPGEQGACWKANYHGLGKLVEEQMGECIPERACWMTKGETMMFQRKG